MEDALCKAAWEAEQTRRVINGEPLLEEPEDYTDYVMELDSWNVSRVFRDENGKIVKVGD
jgi:hypothetical protein